MKKVFLPFVFLLLFSCSVQKRQYTGGYYVSWHKKVSQVKPEKKLLAKEPSKNNVTISVETTKQKVSVPLIADNTPAIAPIVKKKVYLLKTINTQVSDSCDRIVFRDGKETSAKVLEINPENIRYKRCDMPGGPEYVARKGDVFMIVFSNGTKQTFEVSPDDNRHSSAHGATPATIENKKAFYSFLAGILGFAVGVGSIPAIILGSMALKEIRKNPGKYDSNSRSFARIGIGLGIAKIIVTLLILALLIAFI
jgi:hypothetical protein